MTTIHRSAKLLHLAVALLTSFAHGLRWLYANHLPPIHWPRDTVASSRFEKDVMLVLFCWAGTKLLVGSADN